MEEFDAIATNFPFIDSFGVLDVNRWDFALSYNDKTSLVSLDALVVLDITAGSCYLELPAVLNKKPFPLDFVSLYSHLQ